MPREDPHCLMGRLGGFPQGAYGDTDPLQYTSTSNPVLVRSDKLFTEAPQLSLTFLRDTEYLFRLAVCRCFRFIFCVIGYVMSFDTPFNWPQGFQLNAGGREKKYTGETQDV